MSLMNVIFAVIAVGVVTCNEEGIKATLANIPEDGLLDFPELSAKYGHEARSYEITTKDGYISTLFNLPGNRQHPVLFVHGVFDSSDGWILRGNTSLGIILANKGYDVWLLNFRGNRYARKHITLNPDKDREYWDFSAHEYGTYDLPASIDFVLKTTGQKQLSIIGFSEGTTATYILGSTQLEYNDKVKVFIALAPVVFLEKVRPTLSYIINVSPFLNFFLSPFVDEFTGYYSLMKGLLNLMCTQLVIGYELCYLGGMNSVSGMDTVGIERSFFPVIIGHFPAGTSRKNLIHFAQMSLNKRFAQYDYGAMKNLNMYRAFTPPVYDVTKMKMKTVLFSGKNDPVSTLEDVEMLKTQVSSIVEHIVVERAEFNHLDHLWAKDAVSMEYVHVENVLANFTGYLDD